MKLLLDANLSWRLLDLIMDYFPGSVHVEQTGLNNPAKDIHVWDYARKNEFIILTNDDDFLELSLLKGVPPKVILLRIGNQKTKNVANILIRQVEKIDSFSQSEDYGVLEIY